MATMTKKSPFTKGEINLMIKFHLDGFAFNAPVDRTISNHFGATARVNEFGEVLYRAIMKQYMKYEMGDFSAVRDFDRLKYLMLKVFPGVYSDLID